MSQEEIVRELCLKNELDEQLDELITSAGKLVKSTDITKSDMHRAQLSNIINVAMSTQSSVELVINFVRYQIGRGGSARTWQHNNFGKQMIGYIEALKTKAELNSQRVNSRIEETLKKPPEKPIQVNQIWLKMTQMYLGFVMREFVAQGGD